MTMWGRRVAKGNAASFPSLDSTLEKSRTELEGELKAEVEAHLQICIRNLNIIFLTWLTLNLRNKS